MKVLWYCDSVIITWWMVWDVSKLWTHLQVLEFHCEWMPKSAQCFWTFLDIDVGKGRLWKAFLYDCFSRRQKDPCKFILCATRQAWWRKYECGQKSKEDTCKITVPDTAILLCIEEVLNALYMQENATLHLHCTRWAVNAGCCFGNLQKVNRSLDCLPLIVQRLNLHLPTVIAVSGEQSYK